MQELSDMIESYGRKKVLESKERISGQYMLSGLIGEHLRALFDKDAKFSRPWDYYPDLYAEDKKSYEEEKKIQELEDYKERRRKQMEEWNNRFQQGLSQEIK